MKINGSSYEFNLNSTVVQTNSGTAIEVIKNVRYN